MYVSRTNFNYKITKTTAIVTGTLSVNNRYKCYNHSVRQSVKSYCKCKTDN